jgi:dynein heavy chain, axonemal
LARQRKAVGASIERLKSGLSKLQATQHEVDVLVEEASLRAVEVAQKVAQADAFAEQVRC